MDDLIEFVSKAIFALCIIVVIVFLGLIMTALGVDFYYFQKATGIISQDEKSQYVQNIVREEGGCIYFVDTRGNDSKACGSYIKTMYK